MDFSWRAIDSCPGTENNYTCVIVILAHPTPLRLVLLIWSLSVIRKFVISGFKNMVYHSIFYYVSMYIHNFNLMITTRLFLGFFIILLQKKN